jgi:hypothetical protein
VGRRLEESLISYSKRKEHVYFVSIHRESNIELGFVAGVHEILDAQAGNVAVDEQAESVDEVGVSATLVDALAVLQSQLRALNGAFDEVNFIELWRDLAVRLDQLFVNSLLSGSNFSNFGIQQLTADVHAIFQVFKPFCVRPASFFKGLYSGIKAAEYASAKGVV